jgi:hypothetical protein
MSPGIARANASVSEPALAERQPLQEPSNARWRAQGSKRNDRLLYVRDTSKPNAL